MKKDTHVLSLTAIFIAIILLLSFTPLGFINLGFIKATTIQIPVIIGSIILGPKIGALLGSVFGATSLFINTTAPSLLSFAFSPFIPVLGSTHGSPWALVICFIPRILVGVLPYYVFKFITRKSENKLDTKRQSIALATSGVIGSLINTLLVMNLIYFVFKDAYRLAKGLSHQDSIYKAVSAVILVNGVPEAIVSGILVTAIGAGLLKVIQRSKPKKSIK